MYSIRYTRLYPKVEKPLLYALNYEENPIFVEHKLVNGKLTLYYRLPSKIHWSLRTIRNQLPEELLFIVGKYLYRFNIYRLKPKISYPNIKLII